MRSKVLIQTFLNGIHPKGLGTMIAHKGFKTLTRVMEVFILLYQQCCKAQSLLVSVGVTCEMKLPTDGGVKKKEQQQNKKS